MSPALFAIFMEIRGKGGLEIDVGLISNPLVVYIY